MHQGSCLCGEVRYEIHGELGPAFYCHCSRCRKASGSAFASNAVVNAQAFVVVAGAQALRSYVAASGLSRQFCGQCGSPILSQRQGVPVVRVRMGTLDSPVDQGPQAHIYTDSKAPWYDILDERIQHPDRPPA
jgi:hypothetical protein